VREYYNDGGFFDNCPALSRQISQIWKSGAAHNSIPDVSPADILFFFYPSVYNYTSPP